MSWGNQIKQSYKRELLAENIWEKETEMPPFVF